MSSIKKSLILSINEAIFTIGRYVNPEEVEEVLRDTVEYSYKHFTTEETYMKEFNCPEYKYHKDVNIVNI